MDGIPCHWANTNKPALALFFHASVLSSVSSSCSPQTTGRKNPLLPFSSPIHTRYVSFSSLDPAHPSQPTLRVDDVDYALPHSPSPFSSLDPYYFGLQSPSISPLPPLPPLPANTPSPLSDPLTPARNPASIDRRALVGVGELTTPRWAKNDYHEDHNDTFDITFSRNQDPDVPDSPWTIEAVDGELSDQEEVGCFPSRLPCPVSDYDPLAPFKAFRGGGERWRRNSIPAPFIRLACDADRWAACRSHLECLASFRRVIES